MSKDLWLFTTDLDGTLIGNKEALIRFCEIINRYRDRFFLVYNSGRSCENIRRSFSNVKNLPFPDYLIGAMGTEIEIGSSGIQIDDYSATIKKNWDRTKVIAIMNTMNIEQQSEENQTLFKVSYNVSDAKLYQEITNRLNQVHIQVKVVYSSGIFLDIIPQRAGKGQAIEYLRQKICIPSQKVIVAGDSENDVEMFRIPYKGIIVKNAFPKLKALKGKHIFHSTYEFADGVIDGLQFWGALNKYNNA